MRMTPLLAVIALAFTPTLAMAQCGHGDTAEITMSCGDGKTFDAATKTCVPISS